MKGFTVLVAALCALVMSASAGASNKGLDYRLVPKQIRSHLTRLDIVVYTTSAAKSDNYMVMLPPGLQIVNHSGNIKLHADSYWTSSHVLPGIDPGRPARYWVTYKSPAVNCLDTSIAIQRDPVVLVSHLKCF